MLSERDYMRERRTGLQYPATIGILIVNVIVFVVQYLASTFSPI